MGDRALLVWSPTKEIPDAKLEEYIAVAKEKYGYNGEQALGMLFWHKHDLERAVLDLANFTPFPDEWTVEDKVLFEQAFQFHGKSFHRIRQMLPDKSIASLVKFYYSWKKTRSRTSVMDRQEKMKKNDSSENGSDHGSNEDSDNDEKPSTSASGPNPIATNQGNANPSTHSTATNNGANLAQQVNTNGIGQNETGDVIGGPSESESGATAAATSSGALTNGGTMASASLNCTGCGVTCSELNSTPLGKLCGSCYHHWRRTGVLRPTSGPSFMNKRARNASLLGKSGDSHKRRPPRGMYINHDDIVKLANSAQNTSTTTGGTGVSNSIGVGINVSPVTDASAPNDDLLAGMDREIVSLWSQIQLNKQCVSGLKRKIEQQSTIIDRATEPLMARVNTRWNNEELMLAVQGVRKYGRDFQAIADTIGTKSETQLRTFFVNYRRKYNLDNVLKEYEEEQKLLQEQLSNNNNNITNSNSKNGKGEDSITSVSELDSVDASSHIGDKSELLEEHRKSNAKKNISCESDVMEIELVDDELVNGKKSDLGDVLDGSANTVTGSSVASTSSLPTGSVTATSATGMPASSAAGTDGGTPMEVDEHSTSSSAKLSDSSSNSTIIIK
ncbi:REST corepressor 1 [Uranotaenia lowii]|uniref:REST corepressor 1 n=1 Tax=Uranotaenia lowii TaxID=190385 RepID=UPI0024797E26|nr:REST corepressor 1 [Uranotaenia lowii]